MTMTAETIQQVFNFIVAERFYEDILHTYLSNKDERDEFRQHLWDQIISIKPEKLLESWNQSYFKYLYLRIVKNQIVSSDSAWNNKHRKFSKMDIGESFQFDCEDENEYEDNDEMLLSNYEDYIIEKEIKEEKKIKVKVIEQAMKSILLKNPLLLTEIELFKMYFFEKMTYRQIAEKTCIKRASVYLYVIAAETLIKGHIKKYGTK